MNPRPRREGGYCGAVRENLQQPATTPRSNRVLIQHIQTGTLATTWSMLLVPTFKESLHDEYGT